MLCWKLDSCGAKVFIILYPPMRQYKITSFVLCQKLSLFSLGIKEVDLD